MSALLGSGAYMLAILVQFGIARYWRMANPIVKKLSCSSSEQSRYKSTSGLLN
jgi:hypothetical protein